MTWRNLPRRAIGIQGRTRHKLRITDHTAAAIRGAARPLWSGSYARWYQSRPPHKRIRIALWTFILVYAVSPINLDPGVFLTELILLALGIWADRKLAKRYNEAKARNDARRRASGGF